jgi:hypothetical protein
MIRLRLPPSKSHPIHCLSIILPFDTAWTELHSCTSTQRQIHGDMELNWSWDVNSRWSVEAILRTLLHPNVHYRVNKSPPSDPTPCHTNPLHILTPYSFEIRLKYTLPSTPRSHKWLLPLGLLTIFSCAFLISNPWYMCHPPQLSDVMTLIIFGEELWSSSSCHILHPPVISSFLDPNILLHLQITSIIYICCGRLRALELSHISRAVQNTNAY